jgi:hypothetical protein
MKQVSGDGKTLNKTRALIRGGIRNQILREREGGGERDEITG